MNPHFINESFVNDSGIMIVKEPVLHSYVGNSASLIQRFKGLESTGFFFGLRFSENLYFLCLCYCNTDVNSLSSVYITYSYHYSISAILWSKNSVCITNFW